MRGHVDYLLGKVGAPGDDVAGWVARAAAALAERSVADDDRETTMVAIDSLAGFDDEQREVLWQALGSKVEQSAAGDRLADWVLAEPSVGRCPTRPTPMREWGAAVTAAVGEQPSATTRRRLRHRIAIEIAERRGASTSYSRKAASQILPDPPRPSAKSKA